MLSGNGTSKLTPLACLRGLTQSELEALAVSLGEAPFRGRQLAKSIYGSNIASWDEVKNLPKNFIKALNEKTTLTDIEFVEERGSKDDSQKILSKTLDGHYLETVLIRKNGRNTVCLSTQLGCKMNCSFCASSKEGFIRDLRVSEIVNQLAGVKQKTREVIHNLVYMGMGEPLDNLEAVMKSIEIFNASWGYAIPGRSITVSTVGWIPGIEQFSEKKFRQVRLSISIHSPFEVTRSQIVPVNRKYSLKALMETLAKHREKYGREYTFEYTLLSNVNDSDKDAHELSQLARQVGAKVNLIAYNPIEDAIFERPKLEAMRHFRQILDRHNVRNTLRISSGADIDAACGQLRLHRERERAGYRG